MQLSDIKKRVDLHDLAGRLGLERPDANGNYRSPHHKDNSPSLSIFSGSDGQQRWQDFSSDAKGDCFDLVAYVQQCDAGEAIKTIRDWYNLPHEPREKSTQTAKLSTIDYIALQCLKEPAKAAEYLTKSARLFAATTTSQSPKARAKVNALVPRPRGKSARH
jgi:DNA primase